MTLGGALFIRNGLQYDYCFLEAMKCLEELCDEVVVLDAGSDDGTLEELSRNKSDKTMLIALNELEWYKRHGREKLAYFQNLAKSFLSTDYYFLLQGDEIIHEDCFPYIRRAIETGSEAFMCRRMNLWKDCNHYLNVILGRQPCNTFVIRLAKINYESIGDGESINAYADYTFSEDIMIWHYGFVRKKEVMKGKILNMQDVVFEIDHDPKLDTMDVFDWSAWFSEDDLKSISQPHPKFIQNWIINRP